MKISNVLLILTTTAMVLSSCKKKEEPAPATPVVPTTPTSNYYKLDNVTYTGNLGWSSNLFFKFYCSDNPGGGGSKELRLFFGTHASAPFPPTAGTYSVISSVWSVDSTTCAIEIDNDTTHYFGLGGGSITVGKSGTGTTYSFSNIPVTYGKKVTGTFIY